MPRLMSVAYTENAVVERRKTVTRRKGWWEDKNGRRLLHVGDQLTLCRKVMGRKKGEPLVRLAEVEVVDVRRERLGEILTHCATSRAPGYGEGEVYLEGFPDMNPVEFVERFFVDAQQIYPNDLVTRIEWRYLDTRWRDNQGDVWTLGKDGLLHTPETAPFPREHVEKKWGPLAPLAPEETHRG